MRWTWFAGVATALLMAAPSAVADQEPLSARVEGLYQGSGEGVLSLTLINLEADTFAALVTTTVDERCAGRLSGVGKLDENRLEIENVESRDEALCKLTLTFTNRGRSVRIGSSGQCSYFHGAACGFEGNLTQVVVPQKLRPKR